MRNFLFFNLEEEEEEKNRAPLSKYKIHFFLFSIIKRHVSRIINRLLYQKFVSPLLFAEDLFNVRASN